MTWCFNPRPAHASGATGFNRGNRILGFVSIRAPLTRAGRQGLAWPSPYGRGVSIRAPLTRAGRLPFERLCHLAGMFQSAPRSRERGDTARNGGSQGPKPFQSAPRSRERGDGTGRTIDRSHCCFNPRPAHASGATNCASSVLGVSLFQSAPRSRERGDIVRILMVSLNPQFQSAPRSRERGDRRSVLIPTTMQVSIRAPLTRAGRLPVHSSPSRNGSFQSAPRSRERGDSKCRPYRRLTWSFNPRPAHASGATAASTLERIDSYVSIRAPLTRAGRPALGAIPFTTHYVSIRAPLTRAGRQAVEEADVAPKVSFNPRPAHASGAT